MDPSGGPRAWAALRLLRGSVRRRDDDLVVEERTCELLAAVGPRPRARAATGEDARVRRVVAEARERFAERLSLRALAAGVGLHPVYLARLFRRRPRRERGRLRPRASASRRSCTEDPRARSDLPLASIALEGGFSDQAHLTRVFHAEVGTTPAAFRAALLH